MPEFLGDRAEGRRRRKTNLARRRRKSLAHALNKHWPSAPEIEHGAPAHDTRARPKKHPHPLPRPSPLQVSGPSSTVLPPSPFISLILVIEGCGTLEELLPSSSPIRRAASSLCPPTGSENGFSSAHPSATQHGRSPLARRFSSPTVPVPAGAGLVHSLHAGSVFMACAGTAVKLRAARGQKLLLFRATERHELHEAV